MSCVEEYLVSEAVGINKVYLRVLSENLRAYRSYIIFMAKFAMQEQKS